MSDLLERVRDLDEDIGRLRGSIASSERGTAGRIADEQAWLLSLSQRRTRLVALEVERDELQAELDVELAAQWDLEEQMLELRIQESRE